VCLVQSARSGLCLIGEEDRHALYMFNHLEYDADTLELEYVRDRSRRADAPLPENYWPNDDVRQPPLLSWRRPAERFYANWLAKLAARRTARTGALPPILGASGRALESPADADAS
jgi:homoserine O-succinyltransferase/O-acetyltransferase